MRGTISLGIMHGHIEDDLEKLVALLRRILRGEDLKCESVKCTPARMVFMLNGLWISGSVQSSSENDNSIGDIFGREYTGEEEEEDKVCINHILSYQT